MPPFERSTPEEMDGKQKEANQTFRSLPSESIRAVADWWKAWYMATGHKRLGRTLLKQVPSRKVEHQSVPGLDDVSLPSKIRAYTTTSNLKCTFTEENLDSPAMFISQMNLNSIRITLNTSHAAYAYLSSVMNPQHTSDLRGSGFHQQAAIDGLKLLLLSWAIYENDLPPDGTLRTRAQEAREHWALVARRVARQQINDR